MGKSTISPFSMLQTVTNWGQSVAFINPKEAMVFSICRTDLPKKKHQKKWYNPHDVTSSIYIIWLVVLTLLKNI